VAGAEPRPEDFDAVGYAPAAAIARDKLRTYRVFNSR